MMRLQKYMAMCGLASRRKCEEIIVQGRVCVNGEQVLQLGTVIDETSDVVTVDKKQIYLQQEPVYIVLNKPMGVLTSVGDDRGRETIMDLLTDVPERVYPVGRLDYNSEGLLIVTNDGELAAKIMHPKGHLEKEYEVVIRGGVGDGALNELRSGIMLDGVKTLPAKVFLKRRNSDATHINIVITEGRNRQIRRMVEAVGHHVVHLKRIRIGNVLLGRLATGTWRFMNARELNELKSSLGMKTGNRN